MLRRRRKGFTCWCPELAVGGVADPAVARPVAPGEAPVWPYAEGEVRGPALTPLHEYVPEAALADRALYELLALLDAIRTGRSPERMLAQKLLTERMR
jgi:hypothetical protein